MASGTALLDVTTCPSASTAVTVPSNMAATAANYSRGSLMLQHRRPQPHNEAVREFKSSATNRTLLGGALQAPPDAETGPKDKDKRAGSSIPVAWDPLLSNRQQKLGNDDMPIGAWPNYKQLKATAAACAAADIQGMSHPRKNRWPTGSPPAIVLVQHQICLAA